MPQHGYICKIINKPLITFPHNSYLQLMKFILLLFLAFLALSVSAQKTVRAEKVTDHSTHIRGNDFDGIIFNADYKSRYMVYDTATYRKNIWYDPSIGDIISAENSLREYLKSYAAAHPKSSQAFVLANLRKSKRQYAGYIIPNGDKFIYINGFSDYGEFSELVKGDKTSTKKISGWYVDMVLVFDGGPSYWGAIIDLKTGEVTIFAANGVA
jgi:hypothetical protein